MWAVVGAVSDREGVRDMEIAPTGCLQSLVPVRTDTSIETAFVKALLGHFNNAARAED